MFFLLVGGLGQERFRFRSECDQLRGPPVLQLIFTLLEPLDRAILAVLRLGFVAELVMAHGEEEQVEGRRITWLSRKLRSWPVVPSPPDGRQIACNGSTIR